MTGVYFIGHRVFRAFGRGFYDFEVIGKEHLVEDGPAMIVSNHVSYLDAPLIGAAYEKAIHYLAKDSLFKSPAMNWLLRQWACVPLNRERGDSLKTLIRLLKEDKRVLMFPEGERQWDGQLGEAMAGIGLILAKSGAPVQPIYLEGTYEAMPRGKGMVPGTVKMHVGEAWRPELEGRGKGKVLYQEISDEVMERIGALKP